jgi:hypothetical protein
MLKARKSIIVIIAALFVFAGFGTALAFEGQETPSIDGLLSGAFVANVTGPVGPVHNFVNPGGLGQVLLSEYYLARSGYVTFFTVVNTATTGQRARIRFREGADIFPNGTCQIEEPRGSFEILDFDICLSKNDMWSGYIKQNGTSGGMLCNFNDTDTKVWGGNVNAPGQTFAEMAASLPDGVVIDSTHACIPFRFGTNGLANGNITADDTLEGYFEIIGENVLNDTALPPGQDILTCNPFNALAPDHVCNIVNPGTCLPPDNSLFGNVLVVNGPSTGTYTYDSAAIADFTDIPIWTNIQQGTVSPDLSSGTDGLRGVNYILTKEHLFSIYDLLDTPSKQEYSITFPTKSLTQLCGASNDIFDDTTVLFTTWDDKENSVITTCSVSPCPPGTTNHLPFELNVIQLNVASHMSDFLATNLIATGNALNMPFNFGWFDINLESQTAGECTPVGGVVPATCHRTCTGTVLSQLPNNANDPYVYCSDGWPALGLSYIDIGNGFWSGAFGMQYSTDAPCGVGSTVPQCLAD